MVFTPAFDEVDDVVEVKENKDYMYTSHNFSVWSFLNEACTRYWPYFQPQIDV